LTPARRAQRSEAIRAVLTLTLLLFSMPALAGPEGPYFFVEGSSPGTESFPLKSTQVTVNISGVIADVAVTQVYENHGDVPIHAKYVFPGSTRSAVHGMRIRVGDKAVVARIQERQKAAQEFEAARSAGKSASLLERNGPTSFRWRSRTSVPATASKSSSPTARCSG